MMQGRGCVPASKVARGRPRAREPLRWGAEGLQGLGTPPHPRPQPGRRTEAGRAGRGRGEPVGPASLPQAARPGTRTAPEARGSRRSRCLQTRTGARPRPRVPARPPSLRSPENRVGQTNTRPRTLAAQVEGLHGPHSPHSWLSSAPHLAVFNVVLPAAGCRRGPTASLAAAPARPLPTPRPALLSVSGPAPCPTPQSPDASAQLPGANWFPYLSVKDVLPGALG